MKKYDNYFILQEKGQKSRKKKQLKKKQAKKKAQKIKPSKDKPLMIKLIKEWPKVKGYEKAIVSFMEENDITLNGLNDVYEGNFGYGVIIDTDEGEYWFLTDNEADMAARDYVKDSIEDMGPQHIRGYEDFAYISPTDIRIKAGEESNSLREDLKYEGELSEDEIEEKVDERYEYVKAALEKDFVDYFVDETGMYSKEDLMKANFVQINETELVDYVIRSDGRAHSLATYDGEEYNVADNVYYRVN
jgi:hypothetical protein